MDLSMYKNDKIESGFLWTLSKGNCRPDSFFNRIDSWKHRHIAERGVIWSEQANVIWHSSKIDQQKHCLQSCLFLTLAGLTGTGVSLCWKKTFSCSACSTQAFRIHRKALYTPSCGNFAETDIPSSTRAAVPTALSEFGLEWRIGIEFLFLLCYNLSLESAIQTWR